MSKGLTIPLSLDPRDWIQGIKVVERSLDGMEDDLDDVEDASGIMGRKLEDAFDDARRAADKTGRSVNDAERDVDGLTERGLSPRRSSGRRSAATPSKPWRKSSPRLASSSRGSSPVRWRGRSPSPAVRRSPRSRVLRTVEGRTGGPPPTGHRVARHASSTRSVWSSKAEFGQIIKDAFDEAGIAGDTLEEQLKLSAGGAAGRVPQKPCSPVTSKG